MYFPALTAPGFGASDAPASPARRTPPPGPSGRCPGTSRGRGRNEAISSSGTPRSRKVIERHGVARIPAMPLQKTTLCPPAAHGGSSPSLPAPPSAASAARFPRRQHLQRLDEREIVTLHDKPDHVAVRAAAEAMVNC